MGCNCRDKERRSGDNGLQYIIKTATTFINLTKKDVEIYIEGLYKGKNLYNFAPLGSTTDKEIVKTILWQVKE